MITVKEAAAILNVSPKKVYEWITQGRIPYHKLGSHYYLEREKLNDKLAELGLEASTDHDSSYPSISDMIKRGGIYFHVPGSSKKEVLYNALKLIKGLDAKAMEPIYRIFLSREELASTGIGDGIAIPHSRLPLVGYASQPILSLSFLENPVPYDALDGIPVSTLFMLISPNMQTHLRILAKLAFLLQEPTCREQISRNQDANTILDAIAEAEKRFAIRGK